MKPSGGPLQEELKLAKRMWGGINGARLSELRQLLQRHKLSVALGEVVHLNNHWYVTHSGLLRLAFRRGCRGIKTTLEERFSDLAANRWVFTAVRYSSTRSRGYVGDDDAQSSTISLIVHR